MKNQEELAAKKREEAEAAARLARLPKCDNVVPRSACRLAEDDEFVLYSVLVFKKGFETFKQVCRQERYTVYPLWAVLKETKFLGLFVACFREKHTIAPFLRFYCKHARIRQHHDIPTSNAHAHVLPNTSDPSICFRRR